MGHVLWSCPTIKDIWSRCDRPIQKKKSVNHEEFVFIWEELLRILSKEDMEFMAVVARQLWLRRNAFVYGNKINLSSTMVGCVVELLEGLTHNKFS